ARMPGTERVDPAGREPATELCAFLRKEAAGLRVLLRPREVDFLVRGVEVADHEHRAASLQSFDVIEDGTVELELVRHAAVVALAAAALREIAVDDEDASEAGGDEPRSEEHTSELQSRENLVCRLLLEKKKGANRR